jgi:cytochrome c peroxidase
MKKYVYTLTILIIIIIIYACNKKESQKESSYLLDIKHFPKPNLPTNNPLTKDGVRLGKLLFYDTILSINNTISCASCHIQQFAFTDTAKLSLGALGNKGNRHSMTIFNLAWNTNKFFWDGRALTLHDQALFPIEDPLELAIHLQPLEEKLNKNDFYKSQFKKAFNTDKINITDVAKALEQFMLTLVSNQSKYDDYLNGKTNLTEKEERGRFLFFTPYNPYNLLASGANCASCHTGHNFSNNEYANNGIDTDNSLIDFGVYTFSGIERDKGKFKVPSLRNVAISAPYMHDGRFKTLDEVIQHYNHVKGSMFLDSKLQPQIEKGLQLSNEDKQALIAFLNTLTDQKFLNNSEYANPFK